MSTIKNILILFFIIIFKLTSNASISPIDDWNYFFKRGVKQFNAKMHSEALESFHLSASIKANNFNTYNYLGKLYLTENNREKAILFFEKSISINKAQPEIHNSLGLIYEYFVQYTKAYEHFELSTKGRSPKAIYYINLSRIMHKLGKNKRSQELLNVINKRWSKETLELIKKADELKPGKNYYEKTSLLSKALKINPANMSIYVKLSNCHRLKRKYRMSINILEKGKEINPNYTKFYIHLGNLYFNQRLSGHTRQYFIGLSIKNLEEAIKLNPEDMESSIKLSSILRQTGRIDEADKYDKIILEKFKD